VTQIPGFSALTAVTILSETGNDLKDKFPTQKRFVSWLNLVPNNRITGRKVISSKIKKKKNKAGQSFRLAANALKESKCPIGDYFRKVKSREGHGRAIIATAKKNWLGYSTSWLLSISSLTSMYINRQIENCL
jgi:transposase